MCAHSCLREYVCVRKACVYLCVCVSVCESVLVSVCASVCESVYVCEREGREGERDKLCKVCVCFHMSVCIVYMWLYTFILVNLWRSEETFGCCFLGPIHFVVGGCLSLAWSWQSSELAGQPQELT